LTIKKLLPVIVIWLVLGVFVTAVSGIHAEGGGHEDVSATEDAGH